MPGGGASWRALGLAGLWAAAAGAAGALPRPDAPLREVFEGVFDEEEGFYFRDPRNWIIHDPSPVAEIDGHLLVGVTGKEQADGYDCGLETWIVDGDAPGGFRPGQCVLREKPAWALELIPENPGAYWAPVIDGPSRRMYYSISSLGEDTTTCIGLATATLTNSSESPPSPDSYKWEDSGAPVLCQWEGEDNTDDPEPAAIDPTFFRDDDGREWLVYGGGHVWAVELNPKTGKLLTGEEWDNGDSGDFFHLANGPGQDDDDWVEAPHLMKHGGMYYLFVNWYACCRGSASTYQIRVGRSASITGPYVDADGVDMRGGGGKLVMSRDTHGVIGPGHAGTFVYRDSGGQEVEIFSHHYYPLNGTPDSFAQMRTLSWNSYHWPVVSRDQWNPRDIGCSSLHRMACKRQKNDTGERHCRWDRSERPGRCAPLLSVCELLKRSRRCALRKDASGQRLCTWLPSERKGEKCQPRLV